MQCLQTRALGTNRHARRPRTNGHRILPAFGVDRDVGGLHVRGRLHFMQPASSIHEPLGRAGDHGGERERRVGPVTNRRCQLQWGRCHAFAMILPSEQREDRDLDNLTNTKHCQHAICGCGTASAGRTSLSPSASHSFHQESAIIWTDSIRNGLHRRRRQHATHAGPSSTHGGAGVRHVHYQIRQEGPAEGLQPEKLP
jgi:hypothetical protein